MAMNMQQFLLLAEPDFDRIDHEEEQAYEAQYPRIFNVSSMDGLYKRVGKMAGFGPPQSISEGGDVQFDEAIAPVDKRYEIEKFGLAYAITDKLWMNDEYGEVRKFERDLRAADNDHTEQYAFSLLNNGTATTHTGFDGLALFSTAHTRLDGGAVQGNRPSSLTALSLASLEDAVIAFTKLKQDRGRPYRSKPKTLVIPLDLVLVAEEILGSAMRPDTANNSVNAIRRFGLSTLDTPYITSTTFAALIGDKHDLNVMWRMRPKVDSEIVWKSDTINRKTTKWLSRGFAEWRGCYLINS